MCTRPTTLTGGGSELLWWSQDQELGSQCYHKTGLIWSHRSHDHAYNTEWKWEWNAAIWVRETDLIGGRVERETKQDAEIRKTLRPTHPSL